MRLLALDHGSRCGWAIGDGSRLPAVGSRKNFYAGGGAGALEAFWADHAKWLRGVLHDYKPTLVAWERWTLVSRRKTSARSIEITAGLSAITGYVCYTEGFPVRTVTVQEAKIALTGHGNAGKDEMVEAAEAYGLKIEHHDEADAFGVWRHTFRVLEPETAQRFDPLFFLKEGV